jgi:hypothetical protein
MWRVAAVFMAFIVDAGVSSALSFNANTVLSESAVMMQMPHFAFFKEGSELNLFISAISFIIDESFGTCEKTGDVKRKRNGI